MNSPLPPTEATVGVSLQKGANTPVTFERVALGLRWESPNADGWDADAMALLLNRERKVTNDRRLVFYNNFLSPCDSVGHRGDSLEGGSGGDDEVIIVELGWVPDDVQVILFVVNLNDAVAKGQCFGDFDNASIRLVNLDSEMEMFRYDLAEGDVGNETTLIFGELYRHGGGWKFRAIGQGYADGLPALLRAHGVVIDDDVTDGDAPTVAQPLAEPPHAATQHMPAVGHQTDMSTAEMPVAPAPLPPAPPATGPIPVIPVGLPVTPAPPVTGAIPIVGLPPTTGSQPVVPVSPQGFQPTDSGLLAPSAPPLSQGGSLRRGQAVGVNFLTGVPMDFSLYWQETDADAGLIVLIVYKDGSEDTLDWRRFDDRSGQVHHHGDQTGGGVNVREYVTVTLRPDSPIDCMAMVGYSEQENGPGSLMAMGARTVIENGSGQAYEVPVYSRNPLAYHYVFAIVTFGPQPAISTPGRYSRVFTEKRPVLGLGGRLTMNAGPEVRKPRRRRR